MNRTIKFRAWCTAMQKMCRVTALDLNQQGAISVEMVDDSQQFLLTEDAELMQFTNLMDRNGKEIYEGDILLLSKEIFSVAMEPQLLYTHTEYHKVYWSDDHWGLQDSTGNDYDNGDYYRGDAINWNEFEVIGNVHEHPELLKHPELMKKEQ